MNRLDVMDHRAEHELTSVHDNIDSMKAKLDRREESAESRIGDLEAIIKKVCVYVYSWLRDELRSSLSSVNQ
jgi:hypothetical protein